MTLMLRITGIVAGICTYFGGAVLAVAVVKRIGVSLANVQHRTSHVVLLVGGAVNLLIFVVILLLTRLLWDQPLNSIGFQATSKDLLLGLVGLVVTFVSAILFLLAVRHRLTLARDKNPGVLWLSFVILAIVALQEEALFRGYLTLGLDGLSTFWIVVGTTVVFVLIHFPTNRVSRFQVVSWTVGGLVLIAAYLATGSLWTAILFHFATDVANVVIFRITRTHSLFEVEPALTSGELALYRVGYGVLMMLLLALWHGVG